VYLLDDHEVTRRGLRAVLEGEGMVVVGESSTAAEAAARIPALRPQVAVLDARLPDGTGPDLCRRIRAVDRTIRCLILAEDHDEQGFRDAVLAGASGYLLKQLTGQDLAIAASPPAKSSSTQRRRRGSSPALSTRDRRDCRSTTASPRRSPACWSCSARG
jgi:DNA-binding NarL/FixJ family response regulator